MNRHIERHTADQIKINSFQTKIILYWNEYGRNELPWRKTTHPWKILIAEILLRKTTARQVATLYNYLSSFTPEETANMEEDQLEELLTPIGLYKVRSQQIRAAAEAVSTEGMDELNNPDFLINLPGVGKYITNSVLCFSFGEPKPALDTNMIRILTRVFSCKSMRSRPREDPDLWRFAESLVPREKCREFNWGVLDLASSLCKPKNPLCSECPLLKICDFASSKEMESV